MYNPLQLAARYLRYLLLAGNGKGHGIHSPFVYELVEQVLNQRGDFYCYEQIEALRSELLQDRRVLQIRDLGAGSRTANTGQRTVASIARSALKPPKYAQLLFRLADHMRAQTIVELGTSLGLTTAYLANAAREGRVYTFEGVPDIAEVARENLQRLSMNHVTLVEGPFDETLAPTLRHTDRIDMAYIDGNHRLEPTLRYFDLLWPKLHEGSVVVFDDIHWSSEMEQAWNSVKADNRVRLSIDLFFIGLVWFDSRFQVPQHLSIRF